MTQYIYHIKQLAGTASCRLRHCLTLLVLLMGTAGAWAAQPVEITTADDITNNTQKLYLIQTNAFQSFYMAPQTNNTITTNNILGDYMLWYFLDAGTVDGTQYYYIVNNSTGKYICHGGGTGGSDALRAVTLEEKTANNDDRCKFYINPTTGSTGFYNIDAKGKPSYYGLNKRNGSESNRYPIRLTNDQYIDDLNSKWKFIPFNGTFIYPTPPFNPSDDSEKHYYEIHNVQKDSYYASTDATPDKVIFTNQASESRAWYFIEAESDTWYKYYYIINPSTGGKYMYYEGTAENTSDQTDAVSVKAYESANKDRYQFVVVQAARGDGNSRVTCYAIIPKLLIDNLWTSNSLGLADEQSISDGANMGIINSRIQVKNNNVQPNGAHWDFKTTTFSTVCDHPVISFDSTTGKVSITTTTSWSSIYYTTDGTTPSSSNGTLYEGPFALTEQTTVKAIVTKEGYTDSEVTTLTIYKVATPTIQQVTGTHEVSITTTTPGANIYYTTDGTTPTTSSTLYSGASEELAGIQIKAIAVKDGMINSDIGEGEVDIKCATPVISFNNVTSLVTITCGTAESTIYYTIGGNTPTSSSTAYSDPFSVTSPTTVKAIATHTTEEPSDVAELVISQVATPTIQNNGSNAISITTTPPDATIYFTTDGSIPTTSSDVYSSPLTDNVSNKTIKAIAVKEGMITSAVGSGTVVLKCATPVITRNGLTFTLSCSLPTDATLSYTLGGGSEMTYSGTPVSFTTDQLPLTVTAVARHSDYTDSETASMELLNGTGTPTDPYLIYGTTDLNNFVTSVNDGTAGSSCYKLCFDVSATDMAAINAINEVFSGTFDGGYHSISGLSHPLFNTITDGTVKNVVLDPNTTVNGNGAICNEADGSTKIYNCGVLSGTISGSGNVGGLVGHIVSGSSVRVVNCYNFATVSGGTTMAGVVGNNEGTVGDVRIALCMMYGDMPGGTSPVYAGNHTSNASNFNEYNYWRSKADLSYSVYNDQLAIDKDEYLTRFPFYRHILNSHRELAAYFLFGDYATEHVNEIGHWAIDNSKAIYPIVERWETNTRKVLDAPAGSTVNVRKGDGSPITSLNVTVKIGDNSYSASLPITDMDEAKHDYTWGKVVLPFANEFEENTDYSKICTGWKITSITGGTEGHSFDKYDVSDRDCTSKDLYSTTGFVFAQGGNYIVPYNVTDIEITANFATAYYLSDETYEIGYSGDKTGSDASGYIGRASLGGNTPTTYHGQTVYNTLASALNAMSVSGSTHSQAVVLVGNYHQDNENVSTHKTKGLTIMSIDADNNQEPDYAWYSNNTQDRPQIPPTRFDFIALIPVGMSSRVNNTTFYPGIPIWKPCGWFEMTETSLTKMDQFELNSNNFNDITDTRNYRCIINGGYFTQMVRSRKAACNKVKYYQIGGNAYVKEFYPGSHSADNYGTTLCPINVTGGEIEQCFMTGYGKGTAIGSNIYFWCAGGKIDKFLGAYMEKPKQASNNDGTVNMTAKIDHAKIGRFFGGGTSPNARITGNIDITINNSTVDFYCGGPEFGDMENGKTVTTHASNTTFKQYYGAGFGGTAITYTNDEDVSNLGLGSANNPTVTYPSNFFNSHFVGQRLKYKANYGMGSCYKFEFLFSSRGNNSVARFYTGYAKFSLATTGSVTNILDGCTVLTDFYGAGCQGKVNGTVTSTLTDCIVNGSAYGGGYKAENNEVEVYPTTLPTMSVYTREMGLFSDFGTVTPQTFTWVQGTDSNKNTVQGNNLYTDTDVTLTELGNVTGNIAITINGNTNIGENVFGGGNESKSLSNTTVILQGDDTIINGNVFGGGNMAVVSGSTEVNIQE